MNCLFYCIPEYLGGPLAAFGVSVGVHSQRYRLVRMAQGLRHRGHVGPGGDCHACEGVPQLVGVQIRDTAFC